MEIAQVRLTILLLVTAYLLPHCYATDRSYGDINAKSPNGVWRLEAKSPDNQVDGYHPWQDDFVYTMRKGGKRIWQRKQADQDPEEYSPTQIVISDDGWTAIHTAWDQLIFVDAGGRDRSRISDLKKHLSDDDQREFTAWSTAGIIWTPFSLWHFADENGKRLFVIRLWWDHHLIFDPETGDRVTQTPAITNAIEKWQVEHCRNVLVDSIARGVDEDSANSVLTAALLAGQLEIRESIPHLLELTRSEYVGLYGGSMDSDMELGAINPFFVRQFTMRQISQLSLRRLGESPKPLPVFEFPKHRMRDSCRPAIQQDRAKLISSIRAGMSPKEVLDVVGSPDFISYPEWSYDLDGVDPKTATISWDARRVKDIQLMKPLWTDGLFRDKAVVGY